MSDFLNTSHVRIYLLFLFSLIGNIVCSQDHTYSLDEFGYEDGLVYKQIKTVFEDRDGLIWLGTSKGLLRYDGEEFKVWNSSDETGLIYSIKLISQDDEGILWLWNTDVNQFVFLNPITGTIQTTIERFGEEFPKRLDENTNTPGFSLPGKKIVRSSKGHLYFTTEKLNHFYSYHSTTGFKEISISTPHARVLSCIRDTLYVTTDNINISKYTIDGKYIGNKKLSKKDNENIDIFKKVFETPHYSGLMTSIFDKNVSILQISPSVKGIKTVAIDDSKKVCYLLTRESWLALDYNNDTLLHLQATDFKNPDLFRLDYSFLDSRKNVWAYGHFGLVRLKLEKKRFKKVLSKANGSNIACRGILTDEDHIYVNGENVHTTYKISKKDHSIVEGIQFDIYPRPLLALANDELLIGCTKVFETDINMDNIFRRDFYPEENYWWGNNYGVWSLHQDEYGTIWAGKGNYLASKGLADSIFTSHVPSQKVLRKSTTEQCILSIVPEGRDSLWLCSESGLFLLDIAKNEIVNHFHEHENDFLPASRFYHLHKDEAGKYWIGTNKGLIEWGGPSNRDEYYLYTIKDNLSNEVIYAVYEDTLNRLWMSSDYGIMSFAKEDKIVNTYLEKNGISHHEFNRTSHYQEQDGKIYFGGLNGVTYFDPSDFASNALTNLDLVISELKIFDGSSERLLDKTADLLESNTIIFKPSDKYFKLKFSLPTFDGKSNKIYAWKIEGIHTEWNHQQSNSIELGMVPYGDYKLLIRGRTKESSWSQKPLEINLKVIKPFYKTAWFAIVSMLFIASMIIMFFKLRTRMLKEKIKQATVQIMSDKHIIEQQSEDLKKLDRLKTQFFTNVSHELRTPLTLMMGPIKRMMKTSSESSDSNKQMLDMLHRNTVQLRNLVDEILDLSKLENQKMTLVQSSVNLFDHLNNLLKQYYSFCSK